MRRPGLQGGLEGCLLHQLFGTVRKQTQLRSSAAEMDERRQAGGDQLKEGQDHQVGCTEFVQSKSSKCA